MHKPTSYKDTAPLRRLEFVKLILKYKDKLTPHLFHGTHQSTIKEWEQLTKLMRFRRLIKPFHDYAYVRDNFWRDIKKATNSKIMKNQQLDETDIIVCEIMGWDQRQPNIIQNVAAERGETEAETLGTDAETLGTDAETLGIDAETPGTSKNTTNRCRETGSESETLGTDAETLGTDAETLIIDAETLGTDAETLRIDADPLGTDAETPGTSKNTTKRCRGTGSESENNDNKKQKQ